MKKFQALGKSLSKTEQKRIVGGVLESGCTSTYSGCSYINGGTTLTCDYHVQCANGADYYTCEQTCLHGDGSECAG